MIRKVIYNETLLVAAILLVAVVSCQKDNEADNENLVVAESANDESRELLNQLITSRV